MGEDMAMESAESRQGNLMGPAHPSRSSVCRRGSPIAIAGLPDLAAFMAG